MKNKLFFFILFFSLSALNIFCDERRELAEKLINLFNIDATYESTVESVRQMSINLLKEKRLSEEEYQKELRELNESFDVTTQRFVWDKTKHIFISIYAEVYTVEELEGIISFYESEIGQTLIKKQPLVTQLVIQKIQEIIKEIKPALEEEMRKGDT